MACNGHYSSVSPGSGWSLPLTLSEASFFFPKGQAESHCHFSLCWAACRSLDQAVEETGGSLKSLACAILFNLETTTQQISER